MDEKESSELHSGKKETIVSNDLLLTKESIETEMDKDDTESMHRNKDKYDHSSRETAGAVETNKIKSAEIDSSNLLIAEQSEKTKDTDSEEKQTQDESLPANNNKSVEAIESKQQESGIKSRNHFLEKEYKLPLNKNIASRQQKEGRMKLSRMFRVSLFLILSSNITMCAEKKPTMNIDTNEILRKDIKVENHNNTGVQRIDKGHINEDIFKANKCNEEIDLSTAEFSLNEPPTCNRDDGSAYYPPEPKKEQILQKLQRIPWK